MKSTPIDSLSLVRAALRHPRLTDRQRVVLAELASHDPKKFTPHISKLAEWLYGEDNRRNRDYVRKVLRSLEDADVLAVGYDDNGHVLNFDIRVGDVEPTSCMEVTLSERQVTLSERQSDVEPTGLSTSKDNSKRFKKTKTRGAVRAHKVSDLLDNTFFTDGDRERYFESKEIAGYLSRLIR